MNKKNDVLSVNTSAVMREIWLSRTTTQTELSRKLGLNPSTVSRIIGRLENFDLLKSEKIDESTAQVGRKPTAVSLNTGFGFVVGIEIQTDSFHAVAIDLYGTILCRATEHLSSSTDILTAFLKALRCIQDQCSQKNLQMLGVSVGVPAIVDPYKGIINRSNPLGIQAPLDFANAVREQIHVPIFLENDSNCCCWGELASSGPERSRNMLYLLGEFRKYRSGGMNGETLAVGIGIVIDGRVYHGAHGSAGEFQSILWKKGNQSQFSLSDTQILKAQHDREVREAVLRELALHIAYTANILDVTHVVVGGNIVEESEYLGPLLAEEIVQNNSYDIPLQCKINFSENSDYAVAHGAAAMFLEHLFAIPADGRDTPSRHLGIHLLRRIVDGK